MNFQKISNYKEALDFFSKLEFFGIKLGLEQTKKLAELAGNPQKDLRFVHIAGTNGKGTVSAMLASALSRAGLKCALYTSPHLLSPRERFKINGKAISEADFAKFAEKTRTIIEKASEEGHQATYFEAATVLALIYFKAKKADIVIWECGLGGRLDATNIVVPELAVICSIGKDHCEQLGNTFAKIAKEKAGIIKAGIPCFCGKNIPISARKSIKKIAENLKSPLLFADNDAIVIHKVPLDAKKHEKAVFEYAGDLIKINFLGIHQAQNLALVCESLKFLAKKLKFLYKDALIGLSNASLPARMSLMPDGTIIDGGHNPQAVKTVVDNIKYYFGEQKFLIVFGCLKDKDAQKNIRILSRISQNFIFITVNASRKAYTADELLKIYQDMKLKAPARTASLEDALNENSTKKFIVGSFYMAGQALRKYFTDEKIINWRE